ncbi:Aste57867_24677 [Aphanomyces stellatus]|uniref:Aste57867_24677 protein n=1 Tax=Aphanomyces stellatus TaxID=120398 RepID=A0A485LS32_9STRA|nr:hypothetical protein As57867_024599 [Aphanomyces stellatus]VFU01314.1 Aste57867_24677 [Aphanomyces stellatus]
MAPKAFTRLFLLADLKRKMDECPRTTLPELVAIETARVQAVMSVEKLPASLVHTASVTLAVYGDLGHGGSLGYGGGDPVHPGRQVDVVTRELRKSFVWIIFVAVLLVLSVLIVVPYEWGFFRHMTNCEANHFSTLNLCGMLLQGVVYIVGYLALLEI